MYALWHPIKFRRRVEKACSVVCPNESEVLKIFKNVTSSLGGSANVNQNVQIILDFLLDSKELVLEPRDGLGYYYRMEKVNFYLSKVYEVTREEIFELGIDVPNDILNKCSNMLNVKFGNVPIRKHSVYFLCEANMTYSFDDASWCHNDY